jgi:hypothetical protein
MSEIIKHATKNNPYVKKSVVVGILKIAKASVFSGMNNFTEYGVMETYYSADFGFTSQ